MKDHLKNKVDFIEVKCHEPYDFGRYVNCHCYLYPFDKKCWSELLEDVEYWLRERIRLRGYLFVHEVYKWLGYEQTYDGQTHGWTKPEEFGLELKIVDDMDYIEFKNVKNIWEELK